MKSVLLFFCLIGLTWSCSIFSSLTCECFQSDADLPSSIYSHLHCQGSFSSGQRLDLPLGGDAYRLNRFRTVSLEFSLQGRTHIFAHQFENLTWLFVSTPVNSPVEISLRFNHFTELVLHRSALATNISQPKHFQLSFLPSRPKVNPANDFENVEEEQLQFSPETFAGLRLPELTIHIHSMRDRLSSSVPFERIFANSDIGHLHLHGSLIPPGGPLRSNGLIRSLTIYRRVDTIDSKTFPPYPSVQEYRIHSLEAHSMNLSSFQSHRFENLRGLELINPRFPVTIDEYLPRLNWLILDVEHLTARTFLYARQIQSLKLGARLRRIDSDVFYSFPSQLKDLDLSQVDLAELTPDSLCYLIHYLSNVAQRETHLLAPRTSSANRCDCPRLFLQASRRRATAKKTNQACAKRCRFTDCQTISDFFRKKFPLIPEEKQTKDELPSVDFAGDDIDGSLIGFINSQNEPRSPTVFFSEFRPTTTAVVTKRTSTTPKFEEVQQDLPESSEKKRPSPPEQTQVKVPEPAEEKHPEQIQERVPELSEETLPEQTPEKVPEPAEEKQSESIERSSFPSLWVFLLVGFLVAWFFILLIACVVRARRQKPDRL